MGFKYVTNSARFLGCARRVTVYTQRVGAHFYSLAVPGRCLSIFGETHGLGRHYRKVFVNGTRVLARHERAVGFIGPIDEGFRDEAQPVLVRGTLELRSGHTHERGFARRFGYDAGDDIRELSVAHCIVVQGPMWFNMAKARTQLRRNVGERCHLLCQGHVQRIAGQETAFPTKAFTIRVSGMRTDSHTIRDSVTHCHRHRLGVARMCAARYVRTRYDSHELGIKRGTFAKVGIQVNASHLPFSTLFFLLIG
jgi:hypothetical protein